ncbi:MAG: dockerin type I repeat-containing protein [Oscillospiraceae bacterium]|nr:dockerin type I repeat-containing protein [Oscillospiraceae bacterium]
MKALMKHISAAVTALCCAGAMASALPAYAEENQASPTDAKLTTVTSVCPDFVPLGKDEIRFFGLFYNNTHIKITQHSPERKNLLLYESDIQCDPNDIYVFPAEPGDYTIEISTGKIYNSPCVYTYTQDFTIDNADYSTDPQYSKTIISFCGKYLRADDDNAGEMPELLSSESYYNIGEKVPYIAVGFPRYARSRGDYNGDGQVDSADAQLTLNTYADILAGIPGSVLPAAWAAGDINGDGTIDSADAQNILMFYVDAIAGNTPHWPDGTTDGAHDAKYIDHTAVMPSKSYEIQVRAVAYFMNERPEDEAERKSDIDRARTHFTKPITIDTSFVGDSGEFLDADGAKKLTLTFKTLGETQQVFVKNNAPEFPGFAKTEEVMQFDVTDAADNNQKYTSKLFCDTCTGKDASQLIYPCGCYIEYNVNTGEFKAYPFTEAGNPLSIYPNLLADY